MTETVRAGDALIPELQGYRDRLAAVREDAAALVGGLSDAQLLWCPAPGRWSIAECLDHLATNALLMLPRLDEAIRQARERGMLGQGPFRYGMMGRWFTRVLESPPEKVQAKSPKMFLPARGLVPAEAVRRFEKAQGDLTALLARANGIDLGRAKAASPAMRLMRFSVGAWLAITVAHEERHLRQAHRVREDARFPTA